VIRFVELWLIFYCYFLHILPLFLLPHAHLFLLRRSAFAPILHSIDQRPLPVCRLIYHIMLVCTRFHAFDPIGLPDLHAIVEHAQWLYWIISDGGLSFISKWSARDGLATNYNVRILGSVEELTDLQPFAHAGLGLTIFWIRAAGDGYRCWLQFIIDNVHGLAWLFVCLVEVVMLFDVVHLHILAPIEHVLLFYFTSPSQF